MGSIRKMLAATSAMIALAGEASAAPAPVTAGQGDESARFAPYGEGSAAPLGGQVNVLLGGFTGHFKRRKGPDDYNSVQNTVGIEAEARLHGDYYFGLAAAYMKNSLDNDSLLAGLTFKRKWRLSDDWTAGLGLMAGIQNGYPKAASGRDKSEFLPVVYPLAEIYWKRLGIYGTCVPAAYTSGFCFGGFKLRALDF